MGPAGVIWRGEVHDVDLGRPVGRGPAFTRPAVVVSADLLDNGPGGLVVVVPVTSADYGLRSHIRIDTATSGREHRSYARRDQLRVVATERLSRRHGSVGPGELDRIDGALRFVLDL